MSNSTMSDAGRSVVSSCDVTNCTFNRAHQCHAGTIQVAMVDGMAHCATYTPTGEVTGIGTSDVADSVASGTMQS